MHSSHPGAAHNTALFSVLHCVIHSYTKRHGYKQARRNTDIPGASFSHSLLPPPIFARRHRHTAFCFCQEMKFPAFSGGNRKASLSSLEQLQVQSVQTTKLNFLSLCRHPEWDDATKTPLISQGAGVLRGLIEPQSGPSAGFITSSARSVQTGW